jgi:DNA-binding HxlR family transcriptional regulator
MDRVTVRDELNPDCPIRNVLARICDKWSLLVVYTLANNGTMRFGALLKAIPDISQKMLTVTLRTLEEDGLVTRDSSACGVHSHRQGPDIASACQQPARLGQGQYGGDSWRPSQP